MNPPPLRATFDGDPDKLAFFLNQVWAHLDRNAPAYPDKRVMVNAVATNLGEAMEWITSLHDEEASELGNLDIFLEELRHRFRDESQAQQAEVEIYNLKQKRRPAKEFV